MDLWNFILKENPFGQQYIFKDITLLKFEDKHFECEIKNNSVADKREHLNDFTAEWLKCKR